VEIRVVEVHPCAVSATIADHCTLGHWKIDTLSTTSEQSPTTHSTYAIDNYPFVKLVVGSAYEPSYTYITHFPLSLGTTRPTLCW
jgi:hypothetical protein